MHAAAFRALKVDAIYSPFEVPPADLKPILDALMLAGVEGLNVTVPLKQRVMAFCDRIDPAARAIGAVNTLVIRNRRISGFNTDAPGFLKAIEELGWHSKPAHVIVLGAGGAARAVVWALSGIRGVQITVANRHLARAKQLAREARLWHAGACIQTASLNRIPLHDADWLINATTVGMQARDPAPIALTGLRKQTRVYDLIYHRETRLVKESRRRGCVASCGLSMLLYQGAESFRLWTKRRPPVAVMQRALQKAVGLN